MASEISGTPKPNSAMPRVWLLCGQKAGDNNQLLALAEALAWPYEIKHMAYKPYELIAGRLGATLAGIDRRTSDPLQAPWPDLILTAGRRNEAAALWIQSQAGHKVRIVHVGRPWASLHHFDLIVTTPQYQLPRQQNVHYNLLPLHRITPAALADEAARWRPKIDRAPPYLTVLVGGDSGPYLFDETAILRLARQVDELAHEMGASVLISTSARTPPEAFDRLNSEITSDKQLHRFRPGDNHNPYLGFLGLADKIVVTGDSISMLAEACATGKPVHIFPFGQGRWTMRPGFPPMRSLQPIWDRRRFRAWRSRLALTLAPVRLRRDIRQIHQALISAGKASWLGEPLTQPLSSAPLDELHSTVRRVKALFE